MSGSIYVGIPVPSVTITTHSASGVLPFPLVEAYGGGYSQIDLPGITVTAEASGSNGEQYAVITLPSLEVSAYGGAYGAIAIPAVSVTAAGTVTILARAVITLPFISVSSAATAAESAQAVLELPAIEVSAYGGAVCSVVISGIDVQATGTVGAVGSGQLVLPRIQLSAVATVQRYGSAVISIPLPIVNSGSRAVINLPGILFTAIGTATVTVTYEAYALNLKHTNKANDEMTRYTNFPFDRIVRYKNSYYGMNATGLYLLGGTTDDGDPIPWEIKTHVTDFDSPKLKTVQNAYFGGRVGPDATVTLSVGETADNSYSYTTPRGQTAQNYRQVFGKGAKARYFSLGVSGEDSFELDSLELTVTELTRRI